MKHRLNTVTKSNDELKIIKSTKKWCSVFFPANDTQDLGFDFSNINIFFLHFNFLCKNHR